MWRAGRPAGLIISGHATRPPEESFGVAIRGRRRMLRAMSLLGEHIAGSLAAVESLRGLESDYERACDVMAGALRAGHKILACGNGGSAADSAHFTTELLCRFCRDRPSLPAISLAQDGGFLTATANDYGFEHIFSRQVDGLAATGDVLVVLSTSGNSKNIESALAAARRKEVTSVALLGREGGACRGRADIELIVPVAETARIQEAHQVLIHAICSGIERRLFPDL